MNSLTIKYIRIEQRGMAFIMSKMTALELRDRVDFHFREPYSDFNRHIDKRFNSLKDTLEKNEVNFADNRDDGVQRTLNAKRVYSIRDFVNEDTSAIFPNSVLLAVDTSYYDFEIPEFEEQGEFELLPEMHISVIDGQHRLAGLFLAKEEYLSTFEVPVIMLFNIDTPTAAKLFQQINGKQQKVDKSVVFDLFDGIPMDEITNKDDKETKVYHDICKNLYTDNNSPLYLQVKMLGRGGGAISQAFFIETSKKYLKSISDWDINDRYNLLYGYFRKFQELFPEDWPTPINAAQLSYEELQNHSRKVLKERKSQLLKTNGFGAIIRLLSFMINNSISLENLHKLVGKIDWTNIDGTGDAAQTRLFDKLKEAMGY